MPGGWSQQKIYDLSCKRVTGKINSTILNFYQSALVGPLDWTNYLRKVIVWC